jgi:hypothetical protein
VTALKHANRTRLTESPRQLKSFAAKWTIERLPRAWLFTCLACGDEYECTCFPSGALTPRQFKLLRYHRHTKGGRH